MNGKIEAVCISERKGERKTALSTARLIENHGIEGDAHAGPWHRQVSLLAADDVEFMRAKGLPDLRAGDFAENIVVSGLALDALGLGSRIKLGRDAVIRITQLGKVCHSRCAIYHQTGDCIMPRRGLFARVTIEAALCHFADGHSIDLILAVGGTGFAPRDVTPEAVRAVVVRLTPGLDEAMRRASLEQTPHAMLSRAVSGIRGTTLIVSLPGSERAAVENLAVILPALGHGLAKLRGDPADCGRQEGEKISLAKAQRTQRQD